MTKDYAAFSRVYLFGICLTPIIYLFLISVAGIRSPQKKSVSEVEQIGVLVPAHNEKLSIVRTIESLQNAADDDIDINVITDNCSDNTAELAQQTSANVLERYNLDVRGKGAALQWAMQ